MYLWDQVDKRATLRNKQKHHQVGDTFYPPTSKPRKEKKQIQTQRNIVIWRLGVDDFRIETQTNRDDEESRKQTTPKRQTATMQNNEH